MRFQDRRGAGRVALLSVFLALALALGFVERYIPFDFAVPGVKLGLANAAVLAALYMFSPAEALLVSLLKSVMVWMFSGAVTALIFSLSGALLSFFAMLPFTTLWRERFGVAGTSVIGAVFHNIGQILAASVILASVNVIAYLPVLLISGVITGMAVGVLAGGIIKACSR